MKKRPALIKARTEIRMTRAMNVSLSQVPSTTSEEVLGRCRTLVNKKLFPAVSYWKALTTPNGTPANPIVVHRALLACGVEAVANQVQRAVNYSQVITGMKYIHLFANGFAKEMSR